MPAYKYEALDSTGKVVKGVLEADSEKQSRLKLKDMNLIAISSQQLSSTEQTKSSKSFSTKLKIKDLSLLTRQIATLVAANLPLEKALAGTIEQNDKPQIKEVLSAVRAKVLEGLSFSQALKSFPKVFSPLYCETVAAGEQTGRLDMVLNRLADYSEAEQTMKSKIQQALIYPSLMILISIAIICFLLTNVIPKIIGVFQSTGQALPGLTVLLIHISDGIKHYGWLFILLLLVIMTVMKYLLKQPSFKLKTHQMMLNVPFISYFIKTINTARYAHTLAILSSAGVPMLNAMHVAANLITNLSMKNSVNQATKQVQDGRSIHQSLKDTKLFSPMTLHLIASGESSGTLESMLERAAINQDKEIDTLINTGLTLLEPIIILLMGGFVLFIVLATLLPIFSMNQMVN